MTIAPFCSTSCFCLTACSCGEDDSMTFLVFLTFKSDANFERVFFASNYRKTRLLVLKANERLVDQRKEEPEKLFENLLTLTRVATLQN